RIYGIPNDLTTIAQGVPFRVNCDISEVIDPSLLPPGQYKVFATYSNYIQDLDPTPPVFTVWTGSISSTEADLNISGSSIRGGVDVKPGNSQNSWNCSTSGQGSAVALLSGEVFDPTTNTTRLFNPVTEVNLASVRFGKTGTEISTTQVDTNDVNGDGVLDLVFHFGQSGFTCSDIPTGQQSATVIGILTGQTLSDTPISGADSIRLVTGANVK
ncbi:MAG: hypothetical protein ACRDV9_14525, partial [Acidimicrobiia bacterium]